MSILEVEHLTKSFHKTQVLKDINFTMEKSEVLSIIGSSGSGKTTLLRCLNFLETPDSGTIWVSGRPIYDAKSSTLNKEASKRQNRLHFGLVFQSFNLFPQYTALENVTLALKLQAKQDSHYQNNKKAMLEKINSDGISLLDNMGLKDKINNYPHQLSGGQCQRVAIARALALNPDILCFDEPTSALDPELTGEVLRVITELATEDRTMIIVTHEMQFARDVSDKVLFMDNGIILEEGSPDELFTNPKADRTRQFLSRYLNN